MSEKPSHSFSTPMSEEPTITIVSGDGAEFKLNRKAALASPVLAVMIEGGYKEANEGKVVLQDHEGEVVAIVVDYLNARLEHSSSASVSSAASKYDIASRLKNVPEDKKAPLLLKVLRCAHYLEC